MNNSKNIEEIRKYCLYEDKVEKYADWYHSKTDEEIKLMESFCEEFSFRWSPDDDLPNGVWLQGNYPVCQDVLLNAITIDSLQEYVDKYNVESETEDFVELDDKYIVYETDPDTGERYFSDFAQEVYDDLVIWIESVQQFIIEFRKIEQKQAARDRIGKRISHLRKLAGMTQQDLADKIGVLRNNLSRIEAGRYSVGFDTLQAIAEVFCCDIDFIAKR